MKSPYFLAAGVVAALVVLGWCGLAASGGSGEASLDRGAEPMPAPVRTDGSSAAADTDAGATAAIDARRIAVPVGQVLTVRAVDGEGLPLSAVFTVAAFPGGEPPLCDLSPSRASMLSARWRERGVATVDAADGVCRLEYDEPTGVALLVRLAGASAARLLRVGPFAGAAERQIVFGGEPCRVHVFVYDEQLCGPAPGVTVECADERGQVVRSGDTDSRGEVEFELEPAAYMVRVAGADPTDAEARAPVYFAREPGSTRVAVLAVPEATFAVALSADAQFEPAAGIRRSLGLQRIDGIRERTAPAIPVLARGVNRATVQLPAGTYRALVLPQGSLAPVDGAVFEVGAGRADPVSLRLVEPPRAVLELAGIDEQLLPVRVRFLDSQDLDDSVGSQAFAGPLTWHSASAPVGGWSAGSRLLVHRGNRCWLGSLPPFESGGSVRVAVTSATLLHIAVTDPGDRRTEGGLVAAVRHRDGETVRALRRRLQDLGFGRTAVWSASDVVPNGSVAVALATADGEQIAERQLRADGGVTDVNF